MRFFQAVRLLERLSGTRRPVGEFGDPADEVARFAANPSVAFPASEIQAVEPRPDSPPRMLVNFMGLTGPLGVLPYWYTTTIADRVRARDRTLRDFLDMFHHRIISLFYRAWEKSHPLVVYERDRRDPLTRHLRDLVGLGVFPPPERPGLHQETLLFYTGLLLPGQRSALALEQMLEDFFDVPAEIVQFAGGWYPLDADTQCRVSDDEDVAASLGRGAVLGDEIWDHQARVRIKLGPLPRARYEEFLPGGSAYLKLRELTRFFSSDSFDFELQLVLAREQVPGCVLGSDEGGGIRLGWSTWLRTIPVGHDVDDTILTL